MNEFLEIFITQEANNIPVNFQNEINKFLPFYKNIKNDSLTYLFSYYHCRFNYLFDFLNYKIDVNRHYNAEQSRDLISIINDEENLFNELKNSKYSFYMMIHI
jgi:eukaryotic-like serine/threonine-protein kinase